MKKKWEPEDWALILLCSVFPILAAGGIVIAAISAWRWQ